MKICSDTLTILKNFSFINNGIVVKKGNILETVSKEKNVLAKAFVKENFSVDFAIYELNKFLNVISLFADPDFDFGDKSVKIAEEKNRVTYVYANSAMIVSPEKSIKFPDPDLSFKLEEVALQNLLKAASVMGLPDVVISGNKTIKLLAKDTKNPTGDIFSIDTEQKTADKFEYVFKTENMKMLPLCYTVSISEKGIAHFANDRVEYYVCSES